MSPYLVWSKWFCKHWTQYWSLRKLSKSQTHMFYNFFLARPGNAHHTLRADNSETERNVKCYSANNSTHFLNELTKGSRFNFWECSTVDFRVTLSLANVYPRIVPFAFFAREQLPSLTGIPARFHKSQPEIAINNAWGRWKCVKYHVHNFSIIATNHTPFPRSLPLTTNSQAYPHTIRHDSSYHLQVMDSTKSTCPYFLHCSV